MSAVSANQRSPSLIRYYLRRLNVGVVASALVVALVVVFSCVCSGAGCVVGWCWGCLMGVGTAIVVVGLCF